MENTVNWQINSDALFQQMESVNQRMLQMTRDMNTQQLSLTQEATSGMISVMDQYVQKIKSSFDIILQIAQTTWDTAKNENLRSFDAIKQQLDELTRFAKDSSNEQLQSILDSINEKVKAEESYVNTVKSSTDAVISERKRELTSIEDIANATKNIARTGLGGISTAMGSETNTSLIDTGLNMAGKTLGAGIDIATGLEMGRGIQSGFEVVAQGIGLLMNVSKRNDVMKQELFNLFSATGNTPTDVYGGEFRMKDETSTVNRMRTLEAQYAGIKGFDRASQLQTMGSFGQSRLYGSEDLFNMSEQATLLGKGTGLGGSEVAEIFNQLRLKLNTPVDDLAGRFIQLNELSKDMGLSLKQVTNDIIQLSRDNQKYGYSLEQVMSFYKEFEAELKKGTVSAGQLSEYMKGMAETGTEKAVGIAALITSQDPNKVLANFTGNRAVGQEISSLMAGASPLEAAQLVRLINNPTADISNDPALAPIAAKYGLTTESRKRMNPEMERYMMALSQTIAGDSGDLGGQALVYEKMMSLSGMNLPTNLYDRSMYNRGIQGIGDVSGVTSLSQGKELAGTMEANVKENLPKLTAFVERINTTLENSLTMLVNDFNEAKNSLKDNPDALKNFIKDLPDTLAKAYEPILKELGMDPETSKQKMEDAKKSLSTLISIGTDVANIAKMMSNSWLFKSPADIIGKWGNTGAVNYSWDEDTERRDTESIMKKLTFGKL